MASSHKRLIEKRPLGAVSKRRGERICSPVQTKGDRYISARRFKLPHGSISKSPRPSYPIEVAQGASSIRASLVSEFHRALMRAIAEPMPSTQTESEL